VWDFGLLPGHGYFDKKLHNNIALWIVKKRNRIFLHLHNIIFVLTYDGLQIQELGL